MLLLLWENDNLQAEGLTKKLRDKLFRYLATLSKIPHHIGDVDTYHWMNDTLKDFKKF